MAAIRLSSALKKYGPVTTIHGIDLQIDDGEFCVFVGPSGCGKSTLLRMVAGLEETTEGKIFIGDRDVTTVEPAQRGVAMVFQTYALYPHMSVKENMGFGLKMNGHPKEEINKKVSEASRILHLDDYLLRKPKALSGGQRQRVAIGRAIVRGPEVFLFDEPLSNLDAELRVEMRVEIARLHRELSATMIYVTHDQVEAMTLADKIVVLRAGLIEQVGSPMELYRDPDNKFVAGFIGSPAMSFTEGHVDNTKIVAPGLGKKDLVVHANITHHTDVLLGLRPSSISIDSSKNTHTVDFSEMLGGVSYAYLLSQESRERITVEIRDDQEPPTIGSHVGIDFDPAKIFIFDKATEKRIRDEGHQR